MVTREAQAHPSPTSFLATIRGGLDADIPHTASAQFGTAINISTSCATGPDTVVVQVAVKFSDVVNAVVGPVIWILEAASTSWIHALIGNVNASQAWVPSPTKDLKALELFNVVITSQGAAKGFQAFDFVGLNTGPTQVGILVAARAQSGLHVAGDVGTALPGVER